MAVLRISFVTAAGATLACRADRLQTIAAELKCRLQLPGVI